jgi:hypothetical protein
VVLFSSHLRYVVWLYDQWNSCSDGVRASRTSVRPTIFLFSILSHTELNSEDFSLFPRENRGNIEVYLAFGASRFEACRPIAVEALRLALLPTINQMSVIGLISIPGTGNRRCGILKEP